MYNNKDRRRKKKRIRYERGDYDDYYDDCTKKNRKMKKFKDW